MSAATATGAAPSRRQTIVNAVRRRTERLGHDLTLDDVRDALRAEGVAVPPALASEVSSLKRSGGLAARRVGAGWRYAAPGFVPTVAAPLTDGETVLRALRLACDRLGRMVSTREVQDTLEREGWRLDGGARATARSRETVLRHRLATLARERTTSRRGGINRPLARHEERAGAGGRPHSFWAPAERADLAPPAGAAAVSAVEAARAALRDAAVATGRAVSRAELALYVLHLDRAAPVRERLAGAGARPRLAAPLAAGTRPSAAAARVRELRTPWTSAGGAPTRFWLGRADEPPAPVAEAAAVVDDALYAWALDLEAAELARLPARLAAADRTLLAAHLAAREAALWDCARRVRAAAGDAIGAAAERAEGADRTVAAWARGAVGLIDAPWATLRAVADRAGRRRALAAIVGRAAGEPGAGLPIVGVAGVATLPGLSAFGHGVVDTDARAAALAKALGGCRRFPPPDGRTTRRGRDGAWASSAPLAVLDRAEALLTLGGLVPDPWTRVVLARAYGLLGHLSRDAGQMGDVLTTLVTGAGTTPAVGRWAVLAAAMLGMAEALPAAARLLARAQASADAEQDARAAILATALAAPGDAADRVESLAVATRGAHDAVLRRALIRARRGFLLSVAARG